MADLAQVRALPTDLPGSAAGSVLDALDHATARLLVIVREQVRLLDEPSSLAGWSRVTVLAHLRYVAERIGLEQVEAVTDDSGTLLVFRPRSGDRGPAASQ